MHRKSSFTIPLLALCTKVNHHIILGFQHFSCIDNKQHTYVHQYHHQYQKQHTLCIRYLGSSSTGDNCLDSRMSSPAGTSLFLSSSPHDIDDDYNLMIEENDSSRVPLFSTDQSNEEEKQSIQNDSQSDTCDNDTDMSKQILSIALPAFIALSIDPFMALIDTAFIGKNADNADALAGVGTASGILTFSFYLFAFLTSVTTPMVSQSRAAGKDDEAINIAGQVLTLAIILGISLTAILVTFSHSLLDIMGAKDISTDTMQTANIFLQLRAYAATAIFVSSASTGILRGFLDTKTALAVLFASNIVNLILDIILINFAHMHPPTGAAIATTTAEYFSAIYFIGILAGVFPSAGNRLGCNQESNSTIQEPLLSTSALLPKNNDFITIKPVLQIPSWSGIQSLLVASSSSFLRSFVLQLVLAGATAMAVRSGNNEVDISSANIAAHQIALQLWLLCSFLCDALAAASQALISDAIGRNDKNGARDICRTVFCYSLILGGFLSIILFFGSATIFSWFSNDFAISEALKPIVTILALSQPLNAYVFVADGVIQGSSEFVYEAKSMVLSATLAIASFVTLQSLFSTNTLENVWYALTVLMFFRGLTAFLKIADPTGPIDLFYKNTILQ